MARYSREFSYNAMRRIVPLGRVPFYLKLPTARFWLAGYDLNTNKAVIEVHARVYSNRGRVITLKRFTKRSKYFKKLMRYLH